MPATLSAPVVTIDVENDDLIAVTAEAKRRTGKRPSPATVWRWVKKGVRGVRLEAVQLFGAWHTTRAAFGRFIAAQTAAALPIADSDDAPADRSPETAAKLKAAGLL